jgi:hypothetical protein
LPQASSALEPHVDLALDVAPLLGLAQSPDQVVERARVALGEFEPREKIERLAELARVVEAPRDRRQILEADGDVPRARLEDGPALVLPAAGGGSTRRSTSERSRLGSTTFMRSRSGQQSSFRTWQRWAGSLAGKMAARRTFIAERQRIDATFRFGAVY